MLYICQNSQNFTEKRANLNICKLKNNDYYVLGDSRRECILWQNKNPDCITKVWHGPSEEGGLEKYWPKELWKWMECLRLEIKATVYKHSAIIAKVGSQGDGSQQFWNDIKCTPGMHK